MKLPLLAVMLLASTLTLKSAALQESLKPRQQFFPGQIWPDNNGLPINAHGGGLLFHNGTYYWFGEHKVGGSTGNVAHVGVHCYRSVDLYNWTDAGIALPVSTDSSSEIAKGSIIERPKVIYNMKTGKFVMWFHLELKGQGYKTARTAVAISDRPEGPYTFLRSFRPEAGVWPMDITEEEKKPSTGNALQRDFAGGQMSRDMTLFSDDDGKAYLITASEDNHTLQIHELSEDYQSFSGHYARVFPGGVNEAPAVCKHDGHYWMISSGCTGWSPNAARSAVADSIFGPWKPLGNPCRGVNPANKLGPEKTWGGQSTYILPVNGTPECFIAMFDIWNPKNAIDGRYVWLPIRFGKDNFHVTWRNAWGLSTFDSSLPK